MNKNEKIAQEIQQTLAQFEQPERLPSNPFFYTRVKQRLEAQSRRKNIYAVVLKPTLLVILLVMNLSTVVWYFSGNTQNYQTNTRQELLEILADDFNLDEDQNNLLNIE